MSPGTTPFQKLVKLLYGGAQYKNRLDKNPRTTLANLIILCPRVLIQAVLILGCLPILIIMFFLGFLDMIGLLMNSVLTGVYLLNGIVFCSAPILQLVVGGIALGTWCSACTTCLLLVFNRIADVLLLQKNPIFFRGNNTWLVLLLPTAYGLFFALFTPPVSFNSSLEAWLFDPVIPGIDNYEFVNFFHAANNLLVVVITCLLYGVFCIVLYWRRQGLRGSIANKPIFLQATLICCFTLFGALVYVYVQFFPTPDYFILAGHVAWQLTHGTPPFIYLTLNKTIRNSLLRLLRSRRDHMAVFTSNDGPATNNTVSE